MFVSEECQPLSLPLSRFKALKEKEKAKKAAAKKAAEEAAAASAQKVEANKARLTEQPSEGASEDEESAEEVEGSEEMSSAAVSDLPSFMSAHSAL